MTLSVDDPNVDVFATTAGPNYLTSSHTPPANALQICCVGSYGATPQTPTAVLHGAETFTTVRSTNYSGNDVLGIYARFTTASPSAGQVQAQHGVAINGCFIITFSFTSTIGFPATVLGCFADQGGGNLAATGTGTATSGSITLVAASGSGNRPFSVWSHAADEATTERASWTEIGDGSFSAPTRGGEAQWRSDTFETTASASWTTSALWGGLAAEIIEATAGAPTTTRRMLLGVGV